MVCIEQVLKSAPYHEDTFSVSLLYGMFSDGLWWCQEGIGSI